MKYNEEIKKELDEWVRDYKTICDISRESHLKTLKPGDPVPGSGKIYGDAYRGHWEEATKKHYDKITELVDKRESELNEELTAAPSEEALRAVQMFSMRFDPYQVKNHPESSVRESAANEIDTLMTRYGQDNYLTYSTLKDLADRGGIRDFKEHPSKVKMDNLKSYSSYLRRDMDPSAAMSKGLSDAFVSVMKQNVDLAFDGEG